MTEPRRLKQKEIKTVKAELLMKQDWKCAICGINLIDTPSQHICLDHDHKTGFVRGVLCKNCNRGEGKVLTVATSCKRQGTPLGFLIKLLEYWTLHTMPQTDYYHPTHKFEEEKAEIRRKKAKAYRERKKQEKADETL